MSRRKGSGIEVKVGNESIEEQFKKVKEAIKKGEKKGEEVTVYVHRSQWDRWGTPKYMLRAFNVPSKSISIVKLGRATLESLEEKLSDLNEDSEMDRFLKAIYQIGALQTVGAEYTNYKGYPKEKMKEILSIENFENTVHQLEQLNMIEKDKEMDYFGPILSADGEVILREYCEKEIFERLEKGFEYIIEKKGIHPRWIYTYFHKNNHKKTDLSENEIRTSEIIEKNTHFMREIELYGLLRHIVENREESIQHNDQILENEDDFWTYLEEENLSISAQLVTFNKQKVDKVHGKRIRCIPIPIAEKIYELAKDHLHPSEKIIIDLLMLMDEFNSEPKEVEKKISSMSEEDGITIENLSTVVNQLSEIGITSSWSNGKDGGLPYIMKDYEAFLVDFCRDYILGQEDIEL